MGTTITSPPPPPLLPPLPPLPPPPPPPPRSCAICATEILFAQNDPKFCLFWPKKFWVILGLFFCPVEKVIMAKKNFLAQNDKIVFSAQNHREKFLGPK